jgi:hypothetical protein
MTKILKIDRALYEVDDETKTYKYYGRNLEWQDLNPVENEKNKKSIDGYTRIFPDGKQKIFHYQVNKKWCCCRIDRIKARKQKFTKESPCPECYGRGEWFSTCNHKSYICSTCGRKQCLLHWPYPMKTESEAIHFLKGAEVTTGKKCFVRFVKIGKFEKWKIFTSEEDYKSYIETKKHKR